MPDNLNKKILNATKWSTITEVMAKLVAPISSMVLARVLTPDAFGVVATLHMVIAFAEIFTDAGFQRYLIQHEFKDDDDKVGSCAYRGLCLHPYHFILQYPDGAL